MTFLLVRTGVTLAAPNAVRHVARASLARRLHRSDRIGRNVGGPMFLDLGVGSYSDFPHLSISISIPRLSHSRRGILFCALPEHSAQSQCPNRTKLGRIVSPHRGHLGHIDLSILFIGGALPCPFCPFYFSASIVTRAASPLLTMSDVKRSTRQPNSVAAFVLRHPSAYPAPRV